MTELVGNFKNGSIPIDTAQAVVDELETHKRNSTVVVADKNWIMAEAECRIFLRSTVDYSKKIGPGLMQEIATAAVQNGSDIFLKTYVGVYEPHDFFYATIDFAFHEMNCKAPNFEPLLRLMTKVVELMLVENTSVLWKTQMLTRAVHEHVFDNSSKFNTLHFQGVLEKLNDLVAVFYPNLVRAGQPISNFLSRLARNHYVMHMHHYMLGIAETTLADAAVNPSLDVWKKCVDVFMEERFAVMFMHTGFRNQVEQDFRHILQGPSQGVDADIADIISKFSSGTTSVWDMEKLRALSIDADEYIRELDLFSDVISQIFRDPDGQLDSVQYVKKAIDNFGNVYGRTFDGYEQLKQMADVDDESVKMLTIMLFLDKLAKRFQNGKTTQVRTVPLWIASFQKNKLEGYRYFFSRNGQDLPGAYRELYTLLAQIFENHIVLLEHFNHSLGSLNSDDTLEKVTEYLLSGTNDGSSFCVVCAFTLMFMMVVDKEGPVVQRDNFSEIFNGFVTEYFKIQDGFQKARQATNAESRGRGAAALP